MTDPVNPYTSSFSGLNQAEAEDMFRRSAETARRLEVERAEAADDFGTTPAAHQQDELDRMDQAIEDARLRGDAADHRLAEISTLPMDSPLRTPAPVVAPDPATATTTPIAPDPATTTTTPIVPDPAVTATVPTTVSPAATAAKRTPLPKGVTWAVGAATALFPPVGIAIIAANPRVREAFAGRVKEMFSKEPKVEADPAAKDAAPTPFLKTPVGKAVAIGGATVAAITIGGGVKNMLTDDGPPSLSDVPGEECVLVGDVAISTAQDALAQSDGDPIAAVSLAEQMLRENSAACTPAQVDAAVAVASRQIVSGEAPTTTVGEAAGDITSTTVAQPETTDAPTTTIDATTPSDWDVACRDADGDGNPEIHYDDGVPSYITNIPSKYKSGADCRVQPGEVQRDTIPNNGDPLVVDTRGF